MALPSLIEIIPLDKPVQAEITVPGSKSITNRALILAALAEGETTLRGALWSEDTQIMVECLRELGFMINLEPDPDEPCNRTITVYGKGGSVPRGGTEQQPMELFVGNAGTAARFLAAFVCLGQGVYRLHGVPRMHERPQAALFQALRQLGYRIESPNDKLPALFFGAGPKEGKCAVSIEESSQFASALLLCSGAGKWKVEVVGENAEESPYVAMTSKMIDVFPKGGGEFRIEPDASSGSYFWAASRFARVFVWLEYLEEFGVAVPTQDLRDIPPIRVARWPNSGLQIDANFGQVINAITALNIGLVQHCGEEPGDAESFAESARSALERIAPPGLRSALTQATISRARDLGDSIMTVAVLAPFSIAPIRLTDLTPLRLQECERVAALRNELTKCGAKVIEEDDMLTISPSKLHGAEIETYNDHRMAMSFAILGLKVPGIKIKNPSCVKKTFPNFFQKLAATPPRGLGVTILNADSGQPLHESELYAD
ncbi:MAG: hypothetical protein C5B50_30300 [Verrucomicrobia bacterium]|nr:MAG: hypothetical protein C5B50_30300 [Verrucomicrobiota bacterium]